MIKWLPEPGGGGQGSRSACGAVGNPVNFSAVAPVAQLDRVLRFERSGRRFESVRARQIQGVLGAIPFESGPASLLTAPCGVILSNTGS
jgi:hypothetical protein